MSERDLLPAVYAEAIVVMRERGFTAEYGFKSAGPVDLPRAIRLGAQRAGYPASKPCPAQLLAQQQGRTCSTLSRELKETQVVELLRWASQNPEVLRGASPDEHDVPPVYTPRKSWTCSDCDGEIPKRKGKMPKWCVECRAKREAAKPPPKPRLCEGCGHDFGPGRGGAPKFCAECKAKG